MFSNSGSQNSKSTTQCRPAISPFKKCSINTNLFSLLPQKSIPFSSILKSPSAFVILEIRCRKINRRKFNILSLLLSSWIQRRGPDSPFLFNSALVSSYLIARIGRANPSFDPNLSISGCFSGSFLYRVESEQIFLSGMGNMKSFDDKKNQQIDIAAVIRDGREILFQAFNWESHKYDWWKNLEGKVPDLAMSGFTSAWLPPPSQSFAPEGYLPQNLYSLNSAYGSEQLLKSLLQKMEQHKVRPMADIVINHGIGTTQGQGGRYNRYDGIPLSWDERAVTSCTGGLGNRSTGDNFNGVPNIDHTQDFVRKDITKWLQWLRSVGFQDFRFDFARGYSAKYVKEYIEGARPIFSVGEYWDSCNYSSYGLDYNQDSHRQRIINWIDGTGLLASAFDFTTKGILQEAVKGQCWRLRDPQGKPPGVVGWWPSRAVTFLDNHDTGSTQSHWPFPSNHLMEGYAYILTHPGIPSVFYDHLYDWGNSIHDQIVKLMDVRKRKDIHSRSPIRILEAHNNLYSAMIGEKVCMKIGDGSWCPSGREWTLATCGHRYAVWEK